MRFHYKPTHLAFKFRISNIFGLQIFNLLRFVSFLLISIYLTRGSLTKGEIGDFEMLLFIASAVSFFWVTGIIQTLLPLYNNNSSLSSRGSDQRSPELFNAFILLSIFSIVIAAMLFLLKGQIRVYNTAQSMPFLIPLLLYIILSNPACLIEYIYLLNDKPLRMMIYGIISFGLQILFVLYPLKAGMGLEAAVWGLVIITVLRYLWLWAMLAKFSEMRISFTFLKEHLYLALPLVVSTLLSGSAQYIDGLIATSNFTSNGFAVFRYGAKELPIAVMLASGLNNSMLPWFRSTDKIKYGMLVLKKKAARLMHLLFPLSILLLFFSNIIFRLLFTEEFDRSSDIFMVYVLLVTSRLLFPQTILIGLKKTKIIMSISFALIIVNIALSVILIKFYGLVGVALATVIVFFLEKAALMAYNYYKLNIKPNEYTPLRLYIFYSIVLLTIFILIDHKVIMARKFLPF